ncbi:MAG: hypothetical protein ACXIT9_10915 [Nitritalea sp.]
MKHLAPSIGLISFFLIILFFFYPNGFAEMSDFDFLALKNYLFFNIGIYYFFLLKLNESTITGSSDEHLNGSASSRQIFFSQYKRSITQVPMLVILAAFAIFIGIIKIKLGVSLPEIIFELLILGFQYLFFVWLMVFIKNGFKKHGVDLIMIMCNIIGLLTIAARTFDESFWLLFNPFVGWINFILIWPFESTALKIISAFILMAVVYSITLFLTKKFITIGRVDVKGV